MSNRENFAIKLCGKLQGGSTLEVSAREWRLVGQEQDSTQLFTWISVSPDSRCQVTNIGSYSNESSSFVKLFSFEQHLNIIQASVNDSHTLLGYVVKELDVSEQNRFVYKPYLLQLKSKELIQPKLLQEEKNKQVMIQFLYKKSRIFIGKTITDKFLLLVHLESIKSFSVVLSRDGSDDYTEDTWQMEERLFKSDSIVKSFSWAQWDPVHQVLYYIHYRLPVQSSIDGEDTKSQGDITPTLSGLQFHEDLPHETVLNIPLNLPQLPSGVEAPACGLYEDDAVPLRIHDCSLDLQIVSHPSGVVCICHHYLYQPMREDAKAAEEEGVHFAYSVTLLHHGYVTHCVVPDLTWPLAKTLRPVFCLYKEDYLLVQLPTMYTHMLDIGLSHEPCCHVLLPEGPLGGRPVPLLGHGPGAMLDLLTLDIVKQHVSRSQLVSVFKSTDAIENKLAILHYFLHHDSDSEVAEELLMEACAVRAESLGDLTALLREYLLGGAHAATRASLVGPAQPLARLLPFTAHYDTSDLKVGSVVVRVTQERLWNTAMMLLSPRQRIVPFRSDMWTRLWDFLSAPALRFRPHRVLDKLRVSLSCYQPEALSRCSTPLSPAGRRPSLTCAPTGTRTTIAPGVLPFLELDTCTASKQEHVMSVTLREVSMHLLKQGGGHEASAHVHAVATRYVGAQLDTARALCLALCRILHAAPAPDQQRGFGFIDSMHIDHQVVLLKVLESFYLATESLAFPQPQGFSSFLTYLGYRSLTFSAFLQYVHRNVFEIQMDFLKVIIAEAGSQEASVVRALRLAALGGRGRGRRALVACAHPAALLLRARDHAATVLAGHSAPPAAHARRTHNQRGLAAFPSADRLSPLDTFFDLLTAKASLNELDFNLLIDATVLADSNDIE